MGAHHEPAATPAPALNAIDRLLRAERDAQAELAQARVEAEALRARARDEALAIVNRAAQRVARWQRNHAVLLDQRLQAQRERADAAALAAQSRDAPDAAALADAVARVAARLTGGAEGARPSGVDEDTA